MLASRDEELQRGHAERLMPMIKAVLADGHTRWPQIDCIVVTTGPGSFTGIRTGIAAARALALAIPAEVLPLTVFDVLADTVTTSAPDDRRAVLAVLDARRDQVYAQLFDGIGQPLAAPLCGDAGEIAGSLPPDCRAVGSGADLIAAHRDDCETVDIALEARYLLATAWRRLDDGAKPVRGFDVYPLYLRPPDANPAAGRSLLEVAARR